MKISSLVAFFVCVLLTLNARAEFIYLTHGKDAIPDFMQALVKARYIGSGHISKDGLSESERHFLPVKDHEIYFYSVPKNEIINDGQGFELVVDKTEKKFWVMVSGGIGNTSHAFGPGSLQ